jgi:hypothetical protein
MQQRYCIVSMPVTAVASRRMIGQRGRRTAPELAGVGRPDAGACAPHSRLDACRGPLRAASATRVAPLSERRSAGPTEKTGWCGAGSISTSLPRLPRLHAMSAERMADGLGMEARSSGPPPRARDVGGADTTHGRRTNKRPRPRPGPLPISSTQSAVHDVPSQVQSSRCCWPPEGARLGGMNRPARGLDILTSRNLGQGSS